MQRFESRRLSHAVRVLKHSGLPKNLRSKEIGQLHSPGQRLQGWLIGLNGESNILKMKKSSTTIVAAVT
jgi:hypothetical protein